MTILELLALSDESFLNAILHSVTLEKQQVPNTDLKALYVKLCTIYTDHPEYRENYPVFDILFELGAAYTSEVIGDKSYFYQASLLLSVQFDQSWRLGMFVNYLEFLKQLPTIDWLFPDILEKIEPLGMRLISCLEEDRLKDQNSQLKKHIFEELSTHVLLTFFNQRIAESFCRKGLILPSHLTLEPLLALDKSEPVFNTIQRLGTKIHPPRTIEEEHMYHVIDILGVHPSLYETPIVIYQEERVWL